MAFDVGHGGVARRCGTEGLHKSIQLVCWTLGGGDWCYFENLGDVKIGSIRLLCCFQFSLFNVFFQCKSSLSWIVFISLVL